MTHMPGHARVTEPNGDRNNNRRSADEFLALRLAAGQTIIEATRAVGMSERTAYRRLDDSEFQKRIRELRDEMVSRAMGQLCAASTKAAQTLVNLLNDMNPSIRLRAARAILEFGPKLKQQEQTLGRGETQESGTRISGLEICRTKRRR